MVWIALQDKLQINWLLQPPTDYLPTIFFFSQHLLFIQLGQQAAVGVVTHLIARVGVNVDTEE